MESRQPQIPPPYDFVMIIIPPRSNRNLFLPEPTATHTRTHPRRRRTVRRKLSKIIIFYAGSALRRAGR